MTKKTIILIILFLILIGLVGLFILFGKNGAQENTDGSQGQDNGGFLSNLLPFGNRDDNFDDEPRTDTSNILENNNLNSGGTSENLLQQLTNIPIAGFVSSSTPTGNVVRYVDREIGNIFEISETLANTRITNTTIPAVHEAILSSDFVNVVYRYSGENDITKTYLAQIVDPSESSSTDGTTLEINGVFLADDIREVVSDQIGSSILFIEPTTFGVTGRMLSFSESFNTIFESPFSDWNIHIINENIVTATSKPSFFEDGFHYFIDVADGSFTKILGGIKGLTVSTNPSGEFLIVSGSANSNLVTGLYSVPGKIGAELDLVTISDKCVWNPIEVQIAYCGIPTKIPNGSYPDDWYKGKILFSDEIWEINVEKDMKQVIVSPEMVVGEEIDAINLQVSSDGTKLYFINKKDLTLWSLSLDRPIGVDKYEEDEDEILEEEIDS